MATSLHNLSDYDPNTVPDASKMKFAVIVSEWNFNVTGALRDGAVQTLLKHGVLEENIHVYYVPGSFELIAASRMAVNHSMGDFESLTKYNGVIALGCVIRGDTPHFDYVCQGTTQGIAHLNATQKTPVIYGLLTTNNLQQALDRCGGKLGNKGTECAITAIKMADLACRL